MADIQNVGSIYWDPSFPPSNTSCRALVTARELVASRQISVGSYLVVQDPRRTSFLARVVSVEDESITATKDALSNLPSPPMDHIQLDETATLGPRILLKLQILGIMQKREIQPPDIAPRAGSPIVLPLGEKFDEIFHLEEGLEIGNIWKTDSTFRIPIRDDIETLERHLLVLGRSGSGKTHTLKIMIQEATKRGYPVVIVETQTDLALGDVLKPGRDFVVNFWELNRTDVFGLIPTITPPQKERCNDALDDLAEAKPSYTIDDLITRLDEGDPASSRAARKFESIGKRYSFLQVGKKTISNYVRPGKIITVDLAGSDLSVTNAVLVGVFREIFRGRRADRFPPVIVVIDEAQQFIPQGESTSSSSIIREMMRTARKLKISMWLASQSPIDLQKIAIRNSTTKIIHSLDKSDLDATGGVMAGAPPELLELIPQLERGLVLVVSNDIGILPVPVFVKIREKVMRTKPLESWDSLSKRIQQRTGG